MLLHKKKKQKQKSSPGFVNIYLYIFFLKMSFQVCICQESFQKIYWSLASWIPSHLVGWWHPELHTFHLFIWNAGFLEWNHCKRTRDGNVTASVSTMTWAWTYCGGGGGGYLYRRFCQILAGGFRRDRPAAPLGLLAWFCTSSTGTYQCRASALVWMGNERICTSGMKKKKKKMMFHFIAVISSGIKQALKIIK